MKVFVVYTDLSDTPEIHRRTQGHDTSRFNSASRSLWVSSVAELQSAVSGSKNITHILLATEGSPYRLNATCVSCAALIIENNVMIMAERPRSVVIIGLAGELSAQEGMVYIPATARVQVSRYSCWIALFWIPADRSPIRFSAASAPRPCHPRRIQPIRWWNHQWR